MRYKYFIFISFITFTAGILFYLIYNNWIILYHPNLRQDTYNIAANKDQVTLFFMNNNQWQKEQKELILSGDKSQAIQAIIISWLNLLSEEKIDQKRVQLESVALSPEENELFISFNRTPFEPESSTYDKLIWIESLLKTFRENNINLQSVRFLVHHQPMSDSNLDFSDSWPIAGFLNNK